MLILAVESSAKSASAALCRDGELVAMSEQRSGLTHSRTLLPMIRDMLSNTDIGLSDLDGIAVAHGPGSFTGIRIGISTVKGLCWGTELPACGVSTLAAMARLALYAPEDTLICPVMDARRSQVYNALFENAGGEIRRLVPDRALSSAELAAELRRRGRNALLLGDGWSVAANALKGENVSFSVAPEPVRYQNAFGVALEAEESAFTSASVLSPRYLRLSQAERERMERMNKENNK